MTNAPKSGGDWQKPLVFYIDMNTADVMFENKKPWAAFVTEAAYDLLMQQALAMREALKRAADNIGPLCIYPEEAAERHGSLETKAAYKALEQFDEFMKDKK